MNKKLLTVGMCTYDDYNGVYFSVQALRMYHDIFKTDDAEILVIDNNPTSVHGEQTKKFVSGLKNARYIPYTARVSTAVRNEIFNNAIGKYCISMDCHVLLCEKAIEALLHYYMKNPNCKDIVQGPLTYDSLQHNATHFKPFWNASMYGQWATDERYKKEEAFEIPMQGLGVFSCETENWRGFNKLFRGFGGEEGYIHEKFRQFGGKAICVSNFRWVHRFGRPDGVKYPLKLDDRIWNYFIGWLELTQDPEHEIVKGAYEHFRGKIPQQKLDSLFEEAKKRMIL
jgi:hypothetical protein